MSPRATLSAVALALIVAACGGSPNESSSAEPTAEAPEARTEATEPTENEPMSEPTCTDRALEAAAAGTTATERGRLFLEANARCDGIVQTESGLQYEVVEQGDGDRPNATSVVEVHYEGRLLDGTVFDSSYRRNESIQFPLNRVIPGWTEGVALMPVGSTYRLFIPSELAYGERGAPGAFGPNETLVFKVELLDIVE